MPFVIAFIPAWAWYTAAGMGLTMANKVIGIDFGNWQAFVCWVHGMDETTKTGGIVEDLIPSAYREEGADGIPNEFYWNVDRTNNGELYGFEATMKKGPVENHLRLLKQHLGETLSLSSQDGNHSKQFSYDEIITKMFAYHIRLANDALRENYGETATTNLISITYPAKLRDPALLQYYINLAEQADSSVKDEHGNMLKIKVVGTVCEPSAAGLDRLNESRENIQKDHVTYGVFDLGGGTFDLAIVTLYPNGKTYPNGRTYYYDLVCEGRGLNIAGSIFTARLTELMIKKTEKEFGKKISPYKRSKLAEQAERCKKELSKSTSTTFTIEDGDFDVADITITRTEFEKAISNEVNEIIQFTKSFFEDHSAHHLDEIIMTGGSSHIPCFKKLLEETFPAYRNKIFLHRPSKAAAYGAARFYTMHTDTASKQTTDSSLSPVRRTVEYDLGTMIGDIGHSSIETLIAAGTEIPCASQETAFHTLHKTSSTDYDIYKAVRKDPNPKNVSSDYAILYNATLQYGRAVPAKTITRCILSVNELGIATLEAWEQNNTAIRIDCTFPIDNLSDDSLKSSK